MMIAKWISCPSFLGMLLFLLTFGFCSQTSAEIFRCQAEQGGRAVFTDNKYACHLAAAESLTVKPQVLRVERKVMDSIPDLSQREPNAGFPDDGRMFCAPVAVSNSLSHAYGGLASTRQIELAHTLGSAQYMGTGAKGTSPKQLLKGVDRFLQSDSELKSRKILAGQLEYRGQVSVARKYNPTLDKQADLPWLIEGVKQEKHIWLNLGWYQAQDNGNYKRMGGHWVTLVGYEKMGSLRDGKGEYLIINDPATRFGEAQEQVALKTNKLNGRYGYELINQASKPSKADIAWIEGAIQLAL
jgi:hypothetical protein